MKVTKRVQLSQILAMILQFLFNLWCPRLMQAFELEILKLGPSLLITILGRGERRRRHYGGYTFSNRVFSGGEREKLESFVHPV